MGVRWSLKGCAYDVTTMGFFFTIIKMSTKSFSLNSFSSSKSNAKDQQQLSAGPAVRVAS